MVKHIIKYNKFFKKFLIKLFKNFKIKIKWLRQNCKRLDKDNKCLKIIKFKSK